MKSESEKARMTSACPYDCSNFADVDSRCGACNARRFVIEKDGCHVREATPEERDAYLGQGGHPSFFQSLRISPTETVKEDTGPGIWFGGAGF